MSLTNEERKAIIELKVNKAQEIYSQAIGIAELGYWSAVVNRLYYSCYHVVSALLIQHNYTAHTHSGIIRLFGLHFISQGIVSSENGKLYSKLFEMRQTGDYDDYSQLEENDVQPFIEPTKAFIDTVVALLN